MQSAFLIRIKEGAGWPLSECEAFGMRDAAAISAKFAEELIVALSVA